MISIIEHFSDFLGATEHFSGKNGALRWSTGLIQSQSPVEDIADDNISVIKIYIYYKECK